MTRIPKRDQPPPDRQNHLATPAFLASLKTCCECGGPLPPTHRYRCRPCAERAMREAAEALAQDRAKRARKGAE